MNYPNKHTLENSHKNQSPGAAAAHEKAGQVQGYQLCLTQLKSIRINDGKRSMMRQRRELQTGDPVPDASSLVKAKGLSRLACSSAYLRSKHCEHPAVILAAVVILFITIAMMVLLSSVCHKKGRLKSRDARLTCSLPPLKQQHHLRRI